MEIVKEVNTKRFGKCPVCGTIFEYDLSKDLINIYYENCLECPCCGNKQRESRFCKEITVGDSFEIQKYKNKKKEEEQKKKEEEQKKKEEEWRRFEMAYKNRDSKDEDIIIWGFIFVSFFILIIGTFCSILA